MSNRGYVELISLLSDYAINSILYQRGIYPSELFDTTTKYNLKIVETCDDKLKDYLNNVLSQLECKFLLLNMFER